MVCAAALLCSIVLSGLSAASYVQISSPYNATIYNGGSIYLGKVGPGQTFYVDVIANTTNSNGTLVEQGWGRLVATGLPAGWVAKNSGLYTNPLVIEVKPAADAANGTYSFNVTAQNLIGNSSGISPVTFTAYVNVTPNVFNLSVSPSSITEVTGEQSNVYVTINNTGVSDNPFEISITGIPGVKIQDLVIALHHTSKRFVYPIAVDTPGVYHANINVQSTSSPSVNKTTQIKLVAQANLLSDYSAIGKGAVVFPIIYEPANAVMYLISRLIKAV